MRLSSCAALAGALLAPLVDAKLVFGQQYCITSYGPYPARYVPTYYVRTQKTFTFTATSTSTPTQTITPTSTVTATTSVTTTTTAVQRTNTATSTTSSTDIVTTTSTTTSTATETATATTTIAATVTASTSAGFTPFASLAAVVANGGANMKRDVEVEQRDAEIEQPEAFEPRSDILTRGPSDDSCQPPPGHGPGRPSYPQSVSCVVFSEKIVVSKSVKAATTTKTVTAKSSASVTTTSTTTIVSTFVPANVTVTTTSTALTTSTTTSVVTASTTTTSTSTSTSVVPTATSYPQCQADNKVSTVGGRSLYYNIPNGGTTYLSPGAISDDACCQLCAQTDFCVGYSSHQSAACYVFQTVGTCDGSRAGWRAIPQGSSFTVQGNGNCGQAAYSNTF